jgi:hypothetical protein
VEAGYPQRKGLGGQLLDDLTAAPVGMTLGNKHYLVSPLTQGDLGQLLRAIQWEPYTSLLNVPDVPQEVLNETRTTCAKTKVSPNSTEFDEALNNPALRTEFVYLSLKHHQPTITKEDVDNIHAAHISIIIGVCLCLTNPYEEDVTVKDEQGKDIELPGSKKKLANLKAKYPAIFVG